MGRKYCPERPHASNASPARAAELRVPEGAVGRLHVVEHLRRDEALRAVHGVVLVGVHQRAGAQVVELHALGVDELGHGHGLPLGVGPQHALQRGQQDAHVLTRAAALLGPLLDARTVHAARAVQRLLVSLRSSITLARLRDAPLLLVPQRLPPLHDLHGERDARGT